MTNNHGVVGDAGVRAHRRRRAGHQPTALGVAPYGPGEASAVGGPPRSLRGRAVVEPRSGSLERETGSNPRRFGSAGWICLDLTDAINRLRGDGADCITIVIRPNPFTSTTAGTIGLSRSRDAEYGFQPARLALVGITKIGAVGEDYTRMDGRLLLSITVTGLSPGEAVSLSASGKYEQWEAGQHRRPSAWPPPHPRHHRAVVHLLTRYHTGRSAPGSGKRCTPGVRGVRLRTTLTAGCRGRRRRASTACGSGA